MKNYFISPNLFTRTGCRTRILPADVTRISIRPPLRIFWHDFLSGIRYFVRFFGILIVYDENSLASHIKEVNIVEYEIE